MTKVKKSLCILLSMLMLVGILATAPITASAGAPTYFHPGIVTASGYWYAWTWADGEEGYWLVGEKSGNTVTFFGLWDKVVFVLLNKKLSSSQLDSSSWGYTVHQSEDITVNHTKNHFTATKWTKLNKDWNSKNFTGVWADKQAGKSGNPITVKTAVKTVKVKNLKKKAVTVKPLTIKSAKGTVKVVKVKKGSSAIYGKASVNKKTGAIKLKKGKYKAGTYKLKLAITAAGDSSYSKKTVTKVVKIKIIDKLANPITISASSKDILTGGLKTSSKTYKLVTVRNAKGKVKYSKVKKGTSASIYKMISVNAKTGKITFKKGNYGKGTFTIKVKATAKGNSDYKSKSVTATVSVRMGSKFVKCTYCNGTGLETCSECDGAGAFYSSFIIYINGVPYRYRTTCDACGGDGQVECSHCHGEKVIVG